MTEGQTPPTAPPSGYTGPEPDKDSKTMAMLCHLLAIFTGFLGPLIIWLIKKDTSPFVNDQGKEALNFQLTLLIGWLVAFALACITFGIGALIFPVIFIVSIVFSIMGTMAANRGEAYRYPFAIRLIK